MKNLIKYLAGISALYIGISIPNESYAGRFRCTNASRTPIRSLFGNSKERARLSCLESRTGDKNSQEKEKKYLHLEIKIDEILIENINFD